VKFTGNNLANMTVGHGLDNPPELIITKRTDTTVEWGIYTTVVTGGPSTNWLEFNTGAFGSGNYMNVSDTLLSAVATGAYWIQGNQIAYCFHSVPGYSKIGSYSGTSSSGNAITGLGFQPNWLMVKRTDANGNSWLIVDNKRVESNGNLSELFADTTSAESGSGYDIDFTSDGFTLNTTTTNANASGTNNYIYMAFK
jgi:hypothetical protein